ncbi:MAG TPA: hypothetical protein HPP94_16955 [Desulfuromonadales bacterium]|nr:hypothetical protein [Desulfuromonadales bacterium]
MNISATTLDIRTLGGFSIFASGRPVAVDWPNETLKVVFCSLLSPLDISINWDRICRSLWDIPATEATRLRLEDVFIQPLTRFLIKELGCNPLIEDHEGIRIDLQRCNVDAHEFYLSAVEGFRLMSLSNYSEAHKRFRKADELYAGSYLDGLPGKIIAETRKDLESLYQTAVKEAMPRSSSSGSSAWQKRDIHRMCLLAT